MTAAKQSINLERELVKGVLVHKNIRQEMIVTTVDKLKLNLMRCYNESASKTGWYAPFGIFITLLTTLVAADFRDVLGMDKQFWFCLYMIAIGVVGLWLFQELRKLRPFLWQWWKKGLADPIDVIVAAIKEDNESLTEQINPQTASEPPVETPTLPPELPSK